MFERREGAACLTIKNPARSRSFFYAKLSFVVVVNFSMHSQNFKLTPLCRKLLRNFAPLLTFELKLHI
jgi:hypothetical protein